MSDSIPNSISPFPAATAFGKEIPLPGLFRRMKANAAAKKLFLDNVERITWANKLSARTLNVQAGAHVVEIEALSLELKRPVFGEAVCKALDSVLPHQTLFLLHYQERCCAVIGYKLSREDGQGTLPVKHYYHTEWQKSEELRLSISGMDLDAVYENLLRQIHGSLDDLDEQSLEHAVSVDAQCEALQKQIDRLDRKTRIEKQPFRKITLFTELQRLKARLYTLEHSPNH